MLAERSQLRYRIAELPQECSIFRHISNDSDYEAACGKVRPARSTAGVIACKIPRRLLEGLRAAASEAIRLYGVYGWLSTAGRNADDPYVSLSLTYNPDLRDPQIHDVHQSMLGTSINKPSEFYYGQVRRFRRLKHSYFDTYGFRRLTPAAKIGALGEFLGSCRLSLVRSRLSVLRGNEESPGSFNFGWHRDEPVFENLRLNIPLYSHRSFRLQIEHELDRPDELSHSMSQHYLAPGRAYTFDTHRPHRVYAAAACTVDRVHLVLGFSPWFRYDPASDAWAANEFYGRVHPFDIVRSGALHPALRALDD
jgi:hypothetical protein